MAHSFLSPSAAHRWLNCPAAPSIEAKIPDSGSDFALEGTRAHLYAAAALYDGIDMPATAKELRDKADAIDTIGDKAEMLTAAEFYKDIVLDYFAKAVQETPDAELKIEVARLQMSIMTEEKVKEIAKGVLEHELLQRGIP